MCNVGLQAKKEYDSDDEEDAKKTEVVEDPGTLNDEYRWCLSLDCEILSIFLSAALQMATATDIQDIADILGVTFQEHCSATPLKVFCIYLRKRICICICICVCICICKWRQLTVLVLCHVSHGKY